MANILVRSDFVGDVYIPDGKFTGPVLDLAIADAEKKVLIDLLGYTLYNEFITELAGTPASKWTDLRDGATYECGGNTFFFDGCKEMLKYFTYFYYVKNSDFYNSVVGLKQNESENSRAADKLERNFILRQNYNKGIDIYIQANRFITDKNDPTEIYADWLYTAKRKIGIGIF